MAHCVYLALGSTFLVPADYVDRKVFKVQSKRNAGGSEKTLLRLYHDTLSNQDIRNKQTNTGYHDNPVKTPTEFDRRLPPSSPSLPTILLAR